MVVFRGTGTAEGAGQARSILEPATLSPRDLKKIELAVAFIDKHFQARISREGLSMEVRLSTLKLQAGLQVITGYTLSGYQEHVRIKTARELLTDTQLPIRTIARNIGMKTQSHFGEVFKRITGLTPLEYRNIYGC